MIYCQCHIDEINVHNKTQKDHNQCPNYYIVPCYHIYAQNSFEFEYNLTRYQGFRKLSIDMAWFVLNDFRYFESQLKNVTTNFIP